MAKGARLILFGATGDLSIGKLLPALSSWYAEEVPFDSIWCIGRRPFDAESFVAYAETRGKKALHPTLVEKIRYHQLRFEEPNDYTSLVSSMDSECMACNKTLFFLAVKPGSFSEISKNIAATGLFRRGNCDCQLLFEKPFGENLESAQIIQNHLLQFASEEQIYRIDHYLGKEMIRNILALRFSNRIFEETWNSRSIHTVRIISHETAGVEERLEYYDSAGAINDMVQSHLLQMLALVAMEKPHDLESETIRNQKIEVLRHVSLVAPDSLVVGQYDDYRLQAPHLAQSHTETYVRAELEIQLPAWGGTRFILETGKRLSEKRTEIQLEYRTAPLCINNHEALAAEPNLLIIQVYPTEGVHLKFNSKIPGYAFQLESVEAEYCHSCRITGNPPEAYVKLLKDALEGDRTLFAGFEELEIQWKIADMLRNAASNQPLIFYGGENPRP